MSISLSPSLLSIQEMDAVVIDPSLEEGYFKVKHIFWLFENLKDFREILNLISLMLHLIIVDTRKKVLLSLR